MQKLSRFAYTALLFGTLALAACSKDDDDAKTNPNPSNTTGCTVSRFTYSESNYTEVKTFVYNAQQQVIDVINAVNWLPGGYKKVEYNSAGRVSKINFYNTSHTMEKFETFEYNNDGLLTKRELHYSGSSGDPFVLQTRYTYEYDSNKRLVKRSYFSSSDLSKAHHYNEYTYPSANIAISSDYSTSRGTPELISTTEFTFDDKKSPILLLGVLFNDEMLSTHNVLTEKFTSVSPGGFTETTAYTFQYNSSGFPTRVEKSGGDFVLTAEYFCN